MGYFTANSSTCCCGCGVENVHRCRPVGVRRGPALTNCLLSTWRLPSQLKCSVSTSWGNLTLDGGRVADPPAPTSYSLLADLKQPPLNNVVRCLKLVCHGRPRCGTEVLGAPGWCSAAGTS